MAYLTDVGFALLEAVAEIVKMNTYSTPSNRYQPETVITTDALVQRSNGSQVNVRVRMFPGWPVSGDLQNDLKAGISEVSIFPVSGMTRTISKWTQNSYVSYCYPQTLTVTTSGNTATYGGTGGAGQITGIAVGDGIRKTAYAIRLTADDTPDTVVTTLTAMIPNATRSGRTITVAGVTSLLAGVASDSIMNTETALYAQMFDIHIWSPNPQSRDALGALITTGLAEVFNLPFPDGSTSENMKYSGVWISDATQATSEWSLTLRYEVQYPTVTQKTVPGILFMGIELNEQKLIGVFDYRNTDPEVGH